MLSKSCERPDCRGLVFAKGPKSLAKKRYCSRPCADLARPPIPREAKRRGGRRGGKVSGDTRRALAALRTADRLEGFWVRAGVAPDDLPRLKVLLVRAWRAGYATGYQVGYHKLTKHALTRAGEPATLPAARATAPAAGASA